MAWKHVFTLVLLPAASSLSFCAALVLQTSHPAYLKLPLLSNHLCKLSCKELMGQETLLV